MTRADKIKPELEIDNQSTGQVIKACRIVLLGEVAKDYQRRRRTGIYTYLSLGPFEST